MNERTMNRTKREKMIENKRKEEAEEAIIYHLSAGGSDHKC
jgi:hypothetical protein